jgi:SAM-dependent methyltransferase
VSRALAPYVAQLVGVDISPRMVEVYNARANTQGLEPHEMRAVGSLAELQQQRFDLAVVRLLFLSPCNNWYFFSFRSRAYLPAVLDGVPPLCLDRGRHA